jgi:hypothetical protein
MRRVALLVSPPLTAVPLAPAPRRRRPVAKRCEAAGAAQRGLHHVAGVRVRGVRGMRRVRVRRFEQGRSRLAPRAARSVKLDLKHLALSMRNTEVRARALSPRGAAAAAERGYRLLTRRLAPRGPRSTIPSASRAWWFEFASPRPRHSCFSRARSCARGPRARSRRGEEHGARCAMARD